MTLKAAVVVRIVSAAELLARPPLALDLAGPAALRGLAVHRQALHHLARPWPHETPEAQEGRVRALHQHAQQIACYREILARRGGLP